RYRFHPSNRERVPSGISILLDVGDHRLNTQARSSTDMPMQVDAHSGPSDGDSSARSDMSDTSTLMQRPRFKAFPKPAAKARPVSPRDAEIATWFTIYQPLSQVGPDQHQPVQEVRVQIENLQDFHTVLQWQVNRARDTCIQQDANRAKLATWYLEPSMLPRSDHHREVLLSGHPNQWPSDILQRWADFLQPNQPVHLYVVQPDPPGGLPDIVAHVLVVQNAPAQQAAALVSVTELIEDPWHPSRFALFLSNQVTCDDLFEHAGIPQEQVATTPGIGAYHGTSHIPPGSSYPVHHGFAFEVVTDSLDFEGDEQALLQRTHQAQVVRAPKEALENMTTSDSPTRYIQGAAQAMQQLTNIIAKMVAVLAHNPTLRSLPQEVRETDAAMSPQKHQFIVPDIAALSCTAQMEHVSIDTLHRWQHLAAMRPQQASFTTVLLTTIDSANPDMRRRHATMVPSVISRTTLLALAFHPQDCQHSSNTCDAWVGDDALEEQDRIQLTEGRSCTAAIHRRPMPTTDGQDPWGRMVANPCRFRVPICLQAAIPHNSCLVPVDLDETKPQLLWFANEAWKLALEQEEPLPLLPLPDGMTIPDPAYWPLLQPPPTSTSDALSYTLYLDGAANGHDAGWSVIVVACHPEGESFIGCLLGTVQLGSAHPNWLGADTADNIAAELTAMVVAQNLAMRWEGNYSFCIRPDLSLSRTVATTATTCRSNQALAKLCGALGLWLGNRVTIQEIRGHKGHAWNELADAVAKWAMHQRCDPHLQQFTQLHELATNPHDVDWVWMQTTHPALAACFPPLTQQQIMQFTKPSLQLGVVPTERMPVAHQDAATAWLLGACPPITWALLTNHDGPHSWTALCMESCQWMLLHYDSKLPLDSSSTFLDWVRFIRLDPSWKGRLRKTSKLALSYHRARAEHAVWQRHFDARLAAAGATIPDKAKPQVPAEKLQCDLCHKIFASTRALAMHATREHGYKKKVRYFTVGSMCHACGQDFHTRKRLSVHYEKQQKCYDVIQSC
ncbi:unnamed protein product, partial [Cladocopium goreaui]